MRLKLFGSLLTVVSCIVLAQAAGASPLIIDTFNAPAGGYLVNSGPLTGSFGPDSGIGALSATRKVSYAGTNPGSGHNWVTGFEALALNTSSFPGQLVLSTVTSAVQVTLDYTFAATDLSGFGALEMVFNGPFDPGVLPGDFSIVVTFTTGSGALTTTIFPVPISAGGGVLTIPFSGLTGPGSLSSVTGLNIVLNDGGTPATAADFLLDEVRLVVIPEPGTMALFGLGLLGVVAVTLRRKLRAA